MPVWHTSDDKNVRTLGWMQDDLSTMC